MDNIQQLITNAKKEKAGSTASAIGSGLSLLGGVGNLATSFMAPYESSQGADIANSAIDSASALASNFGPWGQLVSGGLQVGKAGFNAIDSIFGSNAKTYNKDTRVDMFSGLGGVSASNTLASNLSGKRYGATNKKGLKKANLAVENANLNKKATNDLLTNTLKRQQADVNSYADESASYLNKMYGNNPSNMLIGKRGIKIKKKNRGKFTESAERAGMSVQEFANKVLANKEDYSPVMVKRANFAKNAATWKHLNGGIITRFRLGGKISSTPNVVVEGVLHAHKNNLASIDPHLAESITEKGVPVVSLENGNIIQHAEVECEELILNKEVTDKLELLYKDGSKDAALKAGKLLTLELIKNTIDKS